MWISSPFRLALLVATAFLTFTTAVGAASTYPSTSGLGSKSALVLMDQTSGKILSGRNRVKRLVPASVTKTFTGALALKQLGPDWRPRTIVRVSGQRSGDVWAGNVYLVGGGDPTLNLGQIESLASQVATTLATKTIQGKIVVDNGLFDTWLGGARTGSSYDPDMGGQLGAITVNRGFGGSPSLVAGTHLQTFLKQQGVKVSGGVTRGPALYNQPIIAATDGEQLRNTVTKMLTYSDNFIAEILNKQLVSAAGSEAACRVRNGLPANGTLRLPTVLDTSAAPVASGATAAGSIALSPGTFAPSSSANQLLDQQPAALTCGTAASTVPAATTSAGANLMTSTARAVTKGTPKFADGSGLSRSNYVSPTHVAGWLRKQAADPQISEAFMNGLPKAGSTGTLAKRMLRTAAVGRCRAKTGTLNAVSALAGFCTSKSGRKFIFVIINNNSNITGSKAFQDRYVARLAAL